MDRLTKLIPQHLQNELKALDRLNDTVLAALPQSVRPHVRVTGIKHSMLRLTTNSQSWASQLRYHESQIVAALFEQTGRADWKIRIRIQNRRFDRPPHSPAPQSAAETPPVSEARHRLRRLLKQL